MFHVVLVLNYNDLYTIFSVNENLILPKCLNCNRGNVLFWCYLVSCYLAAVRVPNPVWSGGQPRQVFSDWFHLNWPLDDLRHNNRDNRDPSDRLNLIVVYLQTLCIEKKSIANFVTHYIVLVFYLIFSLCALLSVGKRAGSSWGK